MSIQDVIKDSVINSLSVGNLFISDIVLALSFASFLGIYIYFIYRFATRNDLNNPDFNKTLALLAMQSHLAFLFFSISHGWMSSFFPCNPDVYNNARPANCAGRALLCVMQITFL